MNSQEFQELNNIHKTWLKYYPLYLDYYEELQMSNSIINIEKINNNY